MRRFIVGILAVIGAMVVFFALAGAGVGLWAKLRAPSIADNTVLTLDIDGALPDGPQDKGLLDLLSGNPETLRDVLDALDRAGGDARIKGVLLRLNTSDLPVAQAQELRDAISAFRAKGKPVFAYADTFGEFAPGTRGYYLAAACDEIWLQPLGLVGLVGLRAEQPFFKGTLDKLGVVPHFEAREQYKTAMNMLTESRMTAPHREETQSLLDSVYAQILAGIEEGRKIDDATLRGLFDKGPFLAQEAVDNRLIDHLGYAGDALDALKNRAGAGAKAERLARYLDQVGHPHRHGPVVAVIHASGLMVRGKSNSNALYGGGVMGSDSVIRAFRLAKDDKDVRAILFRIDSPGGSATAAESIWNEVKAVRQAGKPVVVSMGDVAGSGGYYIAAAANKIVAEPATLTGSIGVVAGKILVGGLADKLGVTMDSVQTSDSAAMFSATEDFTPAGQKRFEAMLDDIYAGFKARVAEGRQMDSDWVESVARGRVWTGEQAKAVSLVDALGGYGTAIALVKAEIGVAASDDIELKTFPPGGNAIAELLRRALGGADEDDALALTLAAWMPLLREIQMLAAPPGSLTMPDIEIR